MLILFAISTILPAAEPEVVVELSGTQIYQGESVLYRVSIRNVEQPPPPELGDMQNFHVQPRGDRSLNQHSVQIYNGHRTESIVYGHAYDFLLTPKRAGILTIPAPTVTVDGQRITGEVQRLRVIAPEPQDMANIEIVADKTSVYPMQAFSVQLKITVKPLPGQFADQDPVAALPRAPALTIPWVDDSQLPSGLEADRKWQQWLGKYQDRRSNGFSINNIGSEPVFSFSMFNDGPLGFLPPSERIELEDADGNPVSYWQYTLPRTFVARQSGEFAFGPVSLKGTFVKTIDSRRQFTGQDVYAVAKPLTVTVKDPPLEGRPPSYTGAIGKFTFTAELSPTEAKVGDPMTLTLTLQGEGNREAVLPPDLASLPEVAEGFKVYEATEQDAGNARHFTYSLRPLTEQAEDFPPVPMTYFDVEKEQYVTVNTDGIPVQIASAEVLSADEILRSASSRSDGEDIQTRTQGLRANDSTLKSLRNDGVQPARWFAGLGSMAGAYLILVLVTQKIQQRLGDPVAVRRRQAASRARRRLHDAKRQSGEDARQAIHLRDALIGLIADAANVPEAGLTTGDMASRLREMHVETVLIERLTKWNDACDAARYGATRDAVHGLTEEADELLVALIGSLKQQKQLG